MKRFLDASLNPLFLTGMALLVSAGFSTETRADEPATQAELKASIERALPYIEERGDWWVKKKKCMSCHRVSFTAWSHLEASRAGIETEPKKIDGWIDWCHENLFSPFPEKDQKYPGEKTMERNLSGAAQMLMLTSGRKNSEAQEEAARTIIKALITGQQQDGSWKPRGQLPLQKRDIVETTHVITMWNAFGIRQYANGQSDAASREKHDRLAYAFVRGYKAGQSSEWLALRALTEAKWGQRPVLESLVAKLLAIQNKDGGWGWIQGGTSDVLATSQIVFILQELEKAEPVSDVGLERTKVEVASQGEIIPVNRLHEVQQANRRAVKYLLAQQRKDGRWSVNGTKKKHQDRPQETASYWGTCWAVIALSRAM